MDLPTEVKEIEAHQEKVMQLACIDTSHLDKRQLDEHAKDLATALEQDTPRIERLLLACKQLPDGIADEFTVKLVAIKQYREALTKK